MGGGVNGIRMSTKLIMFHYLLIETCFFIPIETIKIDSYQENWFFFIFSRQRRKFILFRRMWVFHFDWCQSFRVISKQQQQPTKTYIQMFSTHFAINFYENIYGTFICYDYKIRLIFEFSTWMFYWKETTYLMHFVYDINA